MPSSTLAERDAARRPGFEAETRNAADGSGPVSRVPDPAPGGAESRPAEPERDGQGSAEPEIGRAGAPGLLRRHPAAAATGLAALLLLGAAGLLWWDNARRFESTDDAFIDSRAFAVAPKVGGYVTEVLVTDNQHVAAGDVIARVDQRDYRIALEQAEAAVRAARAAIDGVDAQIAAQQAQVDEAEAQVGQAEAALRFAQEDAERYRELVQRGAGTVQRAQQTESDLRQQQANLARARAAVTAAQSQIGSLRAQRESAVASLAQAEAQRDQARLNLSYTAVTAAQAGRVARLTAAAGQYAQAGTSFAMFVPDAVWVTANFKETQLALMRPGQPVTLTIDAYPGRPVQGRVDSVQPGSGTAFSLLPAQNATGNYVKVVQRVPVKLAMENPPADVSLGPGMSVVPTVRVRPDPSFWERLRGAT